MAGPRRNQGEAFDTQGSIQSQYVYDMLASTRNSWDYVCTWYVAAKRPSGVQHRAEGKLLHPLGPIWDHHTIPCFSREILSPRYPFQGQVDACRGEDKGAAHFRRQQHMVPKVNVCVK